jgi:general secretion pathway protein C
MIKYGFTLLNLLFVGTIAYFGIDAFYLVTEARMEIQQPPDVDRSEISPQKQDKRYPLTHYTAIVDRNLFNTKGTPVAVSPKAVNVEGLQQTSLKLKLWGTVTGKKEEAYAVIEESGTRKQNLFRVGDPVQEATVKLILREKVVLNVKGRDEILELEKPVASKGRAYRPPSQRTAGSRARRPARTRRITLRRSQIDSALEDVNKLMSQVNIKPHFQDGQPDGLMLSRIRPNSIFMRMGLRNGDIITGVNGTNIQSVEDVMSFYENLKTAERLNLQMKRGGRPRTIEYTVR